MTNSIAKHRYTGEQIQFLETTHTHSLIEVTLPPNGDGPLYINMINIVKRSQSFQER